MPGVTLAHRVPLGVSTITLQCSPPFWILTEMGRQLSLRRSTAPRVVGYVGNRVVDAFTRKRLKLQIGGSVAV